MLLTKNRPYKVVGIQDTTLPILQGKLENSVSIHWAELALSSRKYCKKLVGEDVEGSTEEELRSEKNSEENHQNFKDMYFVENVVWPVGSGFRLKYEVRLHGHSKEDNIAESSHYKLAFHWHVLAQPRQAEKAKSSFGNYLKCLETTRTRSRAAFPPLATPLLLLYLSYGKRLLDFASATKVEPASKVYSTAQLSVISSKLYNCGVQGAVISRGPN